MQFSTAQVSSQAQTLQPCDNESREKQKAKPSLPALHFSTSCQQSVSGGSSYNVPFRHVANQKALCIAYQVRFQTCFPFCSKLNRDTG